MCSIQISFSNVANSLNAPRPTDLQLCSIPGGLNPIIFGAEIWSRFNASPDQIIWYYEEMLKVLELKRVTPVLIKPLESAIKVMVSYKRR